jgi:hypothetical protein
MEQDWIKIYSNPDRIQVELVHALLHENGISSNIVDKAVSLIPSMGVVELMVPSQNFDAAINLLREKGMLPL